MHDLIVVGGGIFGVTAALALKKRGHDVAIVDPGPLPHPRASSTDISKAVRLDYGDDVLYTKLMEKARDGWLRWNEQFGPDLYHETGMVMLTREQMAPGGFAHDSYHLLRRLGYDLQRFDGPEIERRFPAFRSGYCHDGYLSPLGGYAESGRVLALLLDRAAAAGVALRPGNYVTGFLEEKGRVQGVVTVEGERFAAGHVVVAAGAWTPWLLPELQVAMRTVGQPVFHLQPTQPARFRPPEFVVFAADVSRTGWYGFPLHPRTGVVKIAYHGPGMPVDPVREVPEVTERQIQALRAFVEEVVPPLADAPLVYTRICLYCDTRDGHFWIDRAPGREGLTVAAGGSGHAFKFAPLLGDWIADAVEGRPDPVLDRFRWRPEVQDVPWQEATRMTEPPASE